MSVIASPPPLPAQKRGWFSRNWKWFIPSLVVLVGLLVAGFVGGIIYLVFSLLHDADVTQDAMTQLRQNSQAVQMLGEPVEMGLWVTGNINYSGRGGGNADLQIPVEGPKAKGTVYLRAYRVQDQWTFEALNLVVDGEAINLLTPTSTQKH